MNEVWTMQQILDPNFLNNLISNPDALSGKVILELSDGKIRVGKRQAFFNLFCFPILTEFGIAIRKDHFIKRKPLNKGVLVKELNRYYFEIMTISSDNAKRLKWAIWRTLTNLYKMCFSNLLEYVGTIDILDMAEIATDPVMKKELDTKNKITDIWPTDMIEDFIESERKKIMGLMGTPGALKNEALLPYQRIAQLNPYQVPQTIYAFGVRTDVDDKIIRKPVLGSALDGTRDAIEYAIESLSAKKSAFYNKNAVRNSQYFGRRQHLLSSSVAHLYSGDCGSTKYVDFLITGDDEKRGIAGNYKNVIGKFIVDNGQLVLLTEKNIVNYLNKTVQMRSPMTCRFRNGVCEVCGGSVLKNINRKILIGILSAITTVEPVTQKILSAKHLIKTNSILYDMNPELMQYFDCIEAVEYRWKDRVYEKIKNWYLGVLSEDFTGLNDVRLIRDGQNIIDQKMSCLSTVFFSDGKGLKGNYDLVQNAQTPFLSSELLIHIRDHIDDVKIKDGIIWIPLKGTKGIPILKTIIINDNMIEYVDTVASFLGGGGGKGKKNKNSSIRNMKTCAEALKAFSDIVYSKCSVNIVHLETLLKAYEITSRALDDYRIPIVEDPNHVEFGSMHEILNHRHVGVKLAFQSLTDYIEDPATYISPKQRSPFDVFVGFKSEQ